MKNCAEHDADADVVCGGVDSCEYDAKDDLDSDRVCADLDSCDYDAENDADGDAVCADADSCRYATPSTTSTRTSCEATRTLTPWRCSCATISRATPKSARLQRWPGTTPS